MDQAKLDFVKPNLISSSHPNFNYTKFIRATHTLCMTTRCQTQKSTFFPATTEITPAHAASLMNNITITPSTHKIPTALTPPMLMEETMTIIMVFSFFFLILLSIICVIIFYFKLFIILNYQLSIDYYFCNITFIYKN